MSQLVSRKIPTTMNPWVCSINNVPYAYPAGTEQMVPEEVAQIIDSYNDYNKPPEAPEPGSQMGGADWNAVEGEPGHIKNKPEFEWIAQYSRGVQIVPEQDTVLSSGSMELGDGTTIYGSESLTGLSAMDITKVLVTVDGEQYKGVISDAKDSIQVVSVDGKLDGKDSLLGGKFCLTCVPHLAQWSLFQTDEEPHTVSVVEIMPDTIPTEFLPGGVPYQEVILPLTDFAYYEQMEAFVHTKKINLVAGKAYTVIYNGVSYECVCKTAEFNGIPLLALGNLVATGGENTGEPFSLGLYGDEVAAQSGGIYLGAFALDGAQSVEFAIYGPDMRKLDERLLPESVDGVVIRSSTEGSTKKFLLTVNDSGTISAAEIA